MKVFIKRTRVQEIKRGRAKGGVKINLVIYCADPKETIENGWYDIALTYAGENSDPVQTAPVGDDGTRESSEVSGVELAPPGTEDNNGAQSPDSSGDPA